MHIKQEIIDGLKKNNVVKSALCIKMKKSFRAIEMWIEANKEDGPLTTTKAINILMQELKLKQNEVLEEETVAQ
jgi:hypothetical protein